jgi:hypothetical protein
VQANEAVTYVSDFDGKSAFAARDDLQKLPNG